jgi:hypothetical protein
MCVGVSVCRCMCVGCMCVGVCVYVFVVRDEEIVVDIRHKNTSTEEYPLSPLILSL